MSPAGALVADGEAACEGSEKAARSLLAAPCAACNTVNEVAIPVDGGRSFTVKCYSCAALNRLTVDTGGGPIVAARTPSDWRDSGGDGDSASARQQQAAQPRGSASELLAAGLASVPLKKRAKSALALSLAAGSEAAAKRKGGQSAAPADRQAPPPAPAPAPPPPQPARTSSASKKVVVRTGHDVVALFHDGYFYGGTVDDAKMSDSAGGPAGGSGRGEGAPRCIGRGRGGSASRPRRRPLGASFLVGWDDGARLSCGSRAAHPSPSEPCTRLPGDDPSWVEAHNVALVSRVPPLCEMASGTRVRPHAHAHAVLPAASRGGAARLLLVTAPAGDPSCARAFRAGARPVAGLGHCGGAAGGGRAEGKEEWRCGDRPPPPPTPTPSPCAPVQDNDSEEEVWFAAEVVGEGRGAEELSLRWIDGGAPAEGGPLAPPLRREHPRRLCSQASSSRRRPRRSAPSSPPSPRRSSCARARGRASGARAAPADAPGAAPGAAWQAVPSRRSARATRPRRAQRRLLPTRRCWPPRWRSCETRGAVRDTSMTCPRHVHRPSCETRGEARRRRKGRRPGCRWTRRACPGCTSRPTSSHRRRSRRCARCSARTARGCK